LGGQLQSITNSRQPDRLPGPRGTVSPRVVNTCLAVAVLLVGVYLLLPHGVTQAVVYDGIGFAAAAAVVVGVRLNRPAHALPCYLFAAGLLLNAIGDVIWDVYSLGLNLSPSPSPADACYLLAYPAFLLGLVLIIRQLGAGQSSAAVTDALIVTAGIAVPTWVLVIARYAHHLGTSVLDRAILIAYPVMDIVLLAVLARLVFVAGTRTHAFRALVGAVAFMTASDLVYAAVSQSYNAGQWPDIGWLLSRILFAAAALYPSMASLTDVAPERSARLSGRRLALLVAASLLAPAVLLVQRAS